jgi:ElaB/YqjD/DUF883 family membrane-anchored ribosome-binding protein
MDSTTTGAAGTVGQRQSDMGAKLGSVMDTAKDQAGQFAQKSSEVTGQAMDKARAQVKNTLSDTKARAATSLSHVADAFRSSSQQLDQQGHSHFSQYADAAADQVGNVCNYLNDKSIDDIVSDTEDFARREPALFVGGALALGILAGRFLRSSSPSPSTDWREAMADTR